VNHVHFLLHLINQSHPCKQDVSRISRFNCRLIDCAPYLYGSRDAAAEINPHPPKYRHTMRIIQISDSHIAHDIPQRLTDLDDCVAEVNSQNPDLVIHTGDITHNGLPQEYNAACKNLEKLKAPYFLLNGNKDSRDLIFKTFSSHSYLKQGNGFIQYCIEQETVRLLVIDTVRESTSKGELCANRLKHLESMLAANTRKPVIIFMHHSPYVVTEIPDPCQFHQWDEVDALETLLSGFNNIQAIYCGHVHRNVQGSIASLPVHVLSCMARDLRKGELSEEDKTRPMYRVIEVAE